MSEDDWYKRWMKRFPITPWHIPDIEEMMKDMEREFMQFKDLEKQVPKELVREKRSPDGTVKREIGPIVYGYSMTIGPDGKPVIREFGNVKGGSPSLKEVTDKREPMVDVVDAGKEIRIVAELPGAKKDEVELMLDGRKMTISADGERKYYRELELPGQVATDRATSSFNNGILEVTLPKESPRKGVRLKIE